MKINKNNMNIKKPKYKLGDIVVVEDKENKDFRQIIQNEILGAFYNKEKCKWVYSLPEFYKDEEDILFKISQ